MYEQKRTKLNKATILVSLLIAVTSLGLFTGLTFGLFKKSDAAVVKDTASHPDFENIDDFVVMEEGITSNTKADLADRLSNASGKVICAVDPDRFKLLSNVGGVKTDTVLVNGKTVRFLVVPQNVEDSVVASIMGTDSSVNDTRCKNVQDGKFFFFQLTPTISYYRVGAVQING